MAKLKDREIQNEIELEIGTNDLPRDAHSKFRFEIKENIEDLMRKMSNPPRKSHDEDVKRMPDWNFEKVDEKRRKSDGDYQLKDPWVDSEAKVWKKEDDLKIETAWGGYVYDIRQNKDAKGCSVEFSGPVNALLRQNLLPEMTYVPHTLEGKFVDKDTGKDLTEYMDMQMYGFYRAHKNEKVDDYGEKGNLQDERGYSVNSKFNNEIPFLPRSRTWQERKQMKADEDFKEGKKVTVHEYQKEEIARRIADVRGKISGAVVADKIAEAKISGEEKRTITPEIGATIRKKMAEDTRQ